jgi:hypothetical protein
MITTTTAAPSQLKEVHIHNSIVHYKQQIIEVNKGSTYLDQDKRTLKHTILKSLREIPISNTQKCIKYNIIKTLHKLEITYLDTKCLRK